MIKYRLDMTKLSKLFLLPCLAVFLCSARAVELNAVDMSGDSPAPSSEPRVITDMPSPATGAEHPEYNPEPVTQSDLGEASYPVIKINPEESTRRSQNASEVTVPVPLPHQSPVRAYPPFEDDESRLVSQAERTRIRARVDADNDEPKPLVARNVTRTTQITAPVHSTQDVYLSPESVPLHSGSKKLAFMLNELILLHKAAVTAGGDIRVTIETVGIDAEDLVMPLKRQGYFEVDFRQNSDRVVIKSKNSENSLLERELADLKETRRRLMDDIASLQAMKGEIKGDSRPSAPRAQGSQTLSYAAPHSDQGEPGTVVLAPRMR
jgi:hypothetical protein